MTEIKITVTVPGLPEAINNLADAIKGYVNTIPAPVTSAPVVKAEATQPDVSNEDKTTPAVNPPSSPTSVAAPGSTNIVADATAAQATAATPAVSTAVNYTIEQLSVAGAALCEQGKMAQLIALLGKYGVQAVTQLKPTPDVLNPFAAELKALGANL